jgi:hypothetical protein
MDGIIPGAANQPLTQSQPTLQVQVVGLQHAPSPSTGAQHAYPSTVQYVQTYSRDTQQGQYGSAVSSNQPPHNSQNNPYSHVSVHGGQQLQHGGVPGIPSAYQVGSSLNDPCMQTQSQMPVPAATAWHEFFPSFFKRYGKEAYALLQDTLGQQFPRSSSTPVDPRSSRDRNYYDHYQKEKAYSDVLRKEIQQEKQRFYEYQQQTEQRIQRVDGIAEKVRSENEAFRAQIVTMGTGRGPLQDENYYIHAFNILNSTISQGVLKLVRQAKQLSTETAPDDILLAIKGLGDKGEKSATFFSDYSLAALYSQVPLKLALTRHVVALFLVHHVFEPYGFGVSEEFSDGLKCVEETLMLDGTVCCLSELMIEPQFSNIALVHQAVGRGILRFTGENVKSLASARGQLQTILRQLLPAVTDDAIEQFVTKVVGPALDLKKAMMEEQALFQVYWIDCDSHFNEDRVEVVDEQPNSNVLLCTYPGLRRISKEDGGEVEHIVVKANAILKSDFKN